MRRRIARVVGSDTKVRVVPDTIDPQELGPIAPARNEFRKRFVTPGTVAVLHTGNMGKKQDLDLLLRAAERLRDDSRVHFYVFGDGAEKGAFLERLAAMGLGNVSHHPLQARTMLPHMLSGADLVLVSQLAEVIDIVVPSKLLTAMASGAMIVAACSAKSETARLMRESEGGVVIAAGDDAALVSVIDQTGRGGLDTETYRRKARQFARRTFDRDTVYGREVTSLLTPAPRVHAEMGSVPGTTLSAEVATEKGVER
jgi:colanic acid biosynthesis glycosyl transferase WcaI